MGEPARSRGSPGSQAPTAAGWYVVWLSRGADTLRQIHLCLGDRAQGAFVCADGDGKFRPLHDPFFSGARWRGPYTSRQEAEGSSHEP